MLGPKIVFLRPVCGPCIGGTTIGIYGRNFNQGTVRIRLEKDEEKLITLDGTWVTESEVQATMPAYNDYSFNSEWGVVEVFVSIAGSRFIAVPQRYRYFVEPIVHEIDHFAVPQPVATTTEEERKVSLLVTANLEQLIEKRDDEDWEIPDTWWAEWKSLLKSSTITLQLHWYSSITNAVSDASVDKNEVLFTDRVTFDVDRSNDEKPQFAWLTHWLPPTVTPGIYSLRLALNGQPAGMASDAKANLCNNFPVQLLHVYKTVRIVELYPRAASIDGNQVLKIHGENYRTFSLKNQLLVRFSKQQPDGTVTTHIVAASLESRNMVLSCVTPQFTTNGWYDVDVSLTDGKQYVQSKMKLLVHLEPTCPYLEPLFGSSTGGMLLSLRISVSYVCVRHVLG